MPKPKSKLRTQCSCYNITLNKDFSWSMKNFKWNIYLYQNFSNVFFERISLTFLLHSYSDVGVSFKSTPCFILSKIGLDLSFRNNFSDFSNDSLIPRVKFLLCLKVCCRSSLPQLLKRLRTLGLEIFKTLQKVNPVAMKELSLRLSKKWILLSWKTISQNRKACS